MPEMDGFQLIESLRRLGCCPGAAVMMLTSKDRNGDYRASPRRNWTRRLPDEAQSDGTSCGRSLKRSSRPRPKGHRRRPE